MNFKKLFFAFFCLFVFTNCEKAFMPDKPNNNPKSNFEALWTLLDHKYSYFKLKNINWNNIKKQNEPLIKNSLSSPQEFRIYEKMLTNLKDGHVNLVSPFNISRYWDWMLDHPYNINDEVIDKYYLKKNYFISGGLNFRIIDKGSKKYGYIQYKSFKNSASSISLAANYFQSDPNVKGIIIDIRNNGGGYLQNVYDLAAKFTDKRRLVLKFFYKNGKSHDSFTSSKDHYLEPSGYFYEKPVVLLINRACYSAASFFTVVMKELPNVTVIGDKTGGGAGFPVEYTLPNGWIIRFSTSRTTDARGKDFEMGVEPDKYVSLKQEDTQNNLDTLIEEAMKIIY